MTTANRVLIVGAGIGGLGAGTALAQRGIEVEVVEIKPEPNVFGVGINQPGNSLRALQALGVLDEVCEVGFQFDAWRFHDHRGNLLVNVPSRLGSEGIPSNNGLSRRDLHNILIGAADRAGVRVQYGTTVSDIAENGGARVTLSNGSEEDFDLVVAFDGINSPLRKRTFGDSHDPVYSGYGVWRVTVPRPEEIDYGGVYQAVGAKAGIIPLSQESMYLFLVTPEPARARYDHAHFAEMLRERLEPFEGIVGDIRDGLQDGDDVVYGPLSEVFLPAPWFRNRVLICGDAAHACTPHLTQGAGMALEDAVVLADELAGDRPLIETLEAFSRRRYPRAKFVQDVSHGILHAEMQITQENIQGAFEHMREALPGDLGGVDDFLKQPA